jgi:hypothetical protein
VTSPKPPRAGEHDARRRSAAAGLEIFRKFLQDLLEKIPRVNPLSLRQKIPDGAIFAERNRRPKPATLGFH